MSEKKDGVVLDLDEIVSSSRTASIREPSASYKAAESVASSAQGSPNISRKITASPHGTKTIPLTLSWHDLSYSIPLKPKKGDTEKKTRKDILKNVTGCVAPGELLAILGTSGAGKTSLLNVLAARVVEGDISGEILVNGEKRTKAYKRQSAYVTQDDVLFANLTVEEMFTYTALLRLPGSLTRAQKRERALEVLQRLALTSCADTRIGDVGRRGVSGGERKRCSIGVELITNPRILFLDEPTSGLDAFTAYHIMETLRDLAQSGHTIICTIHQPRANIYNLFAKVLLMSQGQTVFYGTPPQAEAFFSTNGLPAPAHTNLSDFYLDMITVDDRSKILRETTLERVNGLIHAYKTGPDGSAADEESKAILREYERRINVKKGRASKEDIAALKEQEKLETGREGGWNLGWGEEFSILLSRAWKNISREPRAVIAGLMQSLLMAIITGAIFFGLGVGQIGVRDRTGALFFMVMNSSFSVMGTAVYILQKEKLVFYRERAAGAYRVSSYFLSRTIAEFPITIIFPFIYCCIVYWMVGLRADAGHFFTYMLIIEITVLTAQSIGYTIGSIAPTIEIAQMFMPLCIILLMLFGGFYLNSASVWVGFVWIEAFSFIKYAYTALIVNEFKDETGFVPNQLNNITTGNQVLESLHMEDRNVWEEIGKLCGLIVGFRLMAYLAILFLKKKKYKI